MYASMFVCVRVRMCRSTVTRYTLVVLAMYDCNSHSYHAHTPYVRAVYRTKHSQSLPNSHSACKDAPMND